ncbi:NB-ARC domain-containing protein [Streptomyces sp. NPDC004539]|uniref:NB-ARC domain-containing protein n=1 Tax=Streptomyces sp. NPDC004539 TaxID=3154280 RepID=UPI0033BBF64C
MAISAVGTVASGALSGAGGEAGRRISERLHGLLGRARPEADTTLPVTDSDRTEAARDLVELAHSSPELADEVAAWLREVSRLDRRTMSTAAPRPRMLPPLTAVFTDREDVVEWIETLPGEGDTGGPAVGVLTGPGGIGKTAVAVRGAHRLRERLPDGDLFVDLAGDSAATALTPSEVLARFLEALGVAPDRVPGDEARQRDLYRTLTADRRLLVVLDNAHDDAQVLPLIPASPTSTVLVTSRHRLPRLIAHHGARPRTVEPLSTEDSMLLLTRTVGRAAPEADVRAVAEGTGGYPLAVCTTGAGLAERTHLSWARVAQELRRAEEDGAMTDNPVRHAHDVSYGELPPDTATFYRALGSWAWPALTVPLAAQAAGIPEGQARTQLEHLARVHLLTEIAEERYRFHDAARAHARELALAEDGHSRTAAAVRRVAVAYLKSTASADFRVMPLRWRIGTAYNGLRPNGEPGDSKRALDELSRERENIAATIRAAAHHGFDDLVWQLCEATWSLHLRLGFHAQWIDTHLLGVEAARRQAEEFGNPRAVGRMLVQLAFGHMGVGRAADAETALTEAVAADRACGHHRGEASAVETAGLLQLRLWNWGEAARRFQEARAIWERVSEGDDGRRDKERAIALLDLHTGRAETGAGDFPAALTRLNGALVAFRSLKDAHNEGRVYMCLGELHRSAGNLEQALVCLDKAVDVMTAEGAGLQRADAVEVRADVYRRAGRVAEEAADLALAVECYEANGDSAGAERVRERLAVLEG